MDAQSFLNRTALQQDEWRDIQAIAVTALSRHPFSHYALLRFSEPAGQESRRWLQTLAERITPICPKAEARRHREDSARNVALTREGLLALGLQQGEIETFSFPFLEGMNGVHRSRILGDYGADSAENWLWGGRSGERFHVLLMLFAPTEQALRLLVEDEHKMWTNAGLSTAHEIPEPSRTSTHEHFGFLDGVGQPVIRGTPNAENQKARTGHQTLVNAGEFILGYINEDNVPPVSPFVAASRDPRGFLPPVRRIDSGTFIEDTNTRDLGANGTYLVFRQIEQNVAAFWNAIDSAAHGDVQKRQWLAAKVVGRWPSGSPVTLYPGALTDPSSGQDDSSNNFTYLPHDADGRACPFGAHIRRANPRDSLGDDPKIALASVRRHRILRRGRSYGTQIENPMKDDGERRGLHFVCLNADLERQFEFIQQTWINNPVFNGLSEEVDSLVGKGVVDYSTMTLPACPVRERINGLKNFVTVRGGAYFFLPSIPALRLLASLTADP